MTAEARAEGAKELVLAIFRLAVADYLGHSYSHDNDAAVRRITTRFASDAAVFFDSKWAGYLAGRVGLAATAIRREAVRIAASEKVGARPLTLDACSQRPHKHEY